MIPNANNAGTAELAPLGSITESQFDKIFNVNVRGLVFTVQKALPLFQDGGSIILTASVGGSKGFEGISVYDATKAAVRSFARSWTVDLKNRKIRVNAVSPGPIDTPGWVVWNRSSSGTSVCHWVGWEILMKSQKPSPSLHPMTAVTSQVLNCL